MVTGLDCVSELTIFPQKSGKTHWSFTLPDAKGISFPQACSVHILLSLNGGEVAEAGGAPSPHLVSAPDHP